MYRWSKRKILKLKILSLLLFNRNGLYMSKVLKEGNDLSKKNSLLGEDFLVLDDDCVQTFEDAHSLAFDNIELIEEDLYSFILNISCHIRDFYGSDSKNMNSLDITDDDLIDIGLEIFKSMDDLQVLDLYKRLVTKKNGLLNIQEPADILKNKYSVTMGMNFNNEFSRDNFVSIYRSHTYEDIEVLIHECMHYIIAYACKLRYDRIYFFGELEGNFGTFYAMKYIEEHMDRKQGKLLRKKLIEDIIVDSYKLLVNNCLFGTSEDLKFNLTKANEELTRIFEEPHYIDTDELMQFLVLNGYIEVGNIASYITTLLMMDSLSPHEIINQIKIIRMLEEKNIKPLSNLTGNGIDIIGDEYKTLIKEYKYTHNI